jgi:hypothetical protein
MAHYVMDYETLSDCFIGVFEHYKLNKVKVFCCNKFQNDIADLLKFFKENMLLNEWHVSFNGNAFDAQITNHIINNADVLTHMSGKGVAMNIYAKAQDCISRQDRGDWQEYSERDFHIKQVDIFKLNHWDNPAKRSSLKWIQCNMNWRNVQDMPLHHTTKIRSQEQVDDILSYCFNDVSSTKAIMNISKEQINLRGFLTNEYKIPLYSASEPRIAKELFLYFLVKKTGKSKKQIKYARTHRNEIVVKDILLPYLNFTTETFKGLYQKFSKLILDGTNLKGSIKHSVKYRGVDVDFGLGGVHGAKKGIYIPNEDMTIMSSDVVSYYPNLAIRNGWSPAHLPKAEFCELYEWFFNERKKIPKSNPKNYVYKIVLNSTYGLSNDKNSFLFDPQFTMQITINGQLSLMMLFEMLSERITGAIPIMTNTDGVEIMIPKTAIPQYMEICKEWEDLTKLKLEHDQYQKLIIPDVNNYIGVFDHKEVSKEEFFKLQSKNPESVYKKSEGKYYYGATKCKGRFEFKNRALHKNASFMIIPKALFHYFVHGKNPNDFILQSRNIFDFCGMAKTKKGWEFNYNYINDGEIHTDTLQKTLRYFISDKGGKIIKHNVYDDRDINVVSGKWLQTIFNKYEECNWSDYRINYDFYLERINNEIKSMRPELFINQYSLF